MHLLFVSDEDLCRGPLARAIARKYAADAELTGCAFDSAGLAVARSMRPAPKVVAFAHTRDLSIARHLSCPLQPSQARAANMILCFTGRIAERTRKTLPEAHRAKVLVLNEAAGFKSRKESIDILRPPVLDNGTLLLLCTRIKAAVGKIVRNIELGCTGEDFGIPPMEASQNSYLDDPVMRRFLAKYLHEVIAGAPQAIGTHDLSQALELFGRPLSDNDLQELLRFDLKGKVDEDRRGNWVSREAVEPEPAAGPPPRNGPSAEPRREAPKPPPTDVKITFTEALEILRATMDTPREQAQKTYKQMLTRYHPDKFPDDESFRRMAEEKTKQLNAAWGMVKERLRSGE